MKRSPLYAVLVAMLSAIGLVTIASGSALASTGALVLDPNCQANVLDANDDGSTAAVDVGFPIDLFGTTATQLFVNNNGNVTLTESLSEFTPFGLTGDVPDPIIAPFFGDVDTDGAGSGLVHYGQTTYQGDKAFCVDWFTQTGSATTGVGYFDSHDDLLNTFQLLLVDRSVAGDNSTIGDFDVYFNYGGIQWETGDASDGVGGMGGSCAHAGYSNGGADSFNRSLEIDGSGECGALLDSGAKALSTHSSDALSQPAGRWLYAVRAGDAPTGGSVNGDVVTSDLSPKSGVAVEACGETTGICRATLSGDDGSYSIALLPTDTYDLTAYAPSDSFRDATGSASVTEPDATGPVQLALGTAATMNGLNSTLVSSAFGSQSTGVPSIVWTEQAPFTTTGCAGGSGNYVLHVQGDYGSDSQDFHGTFIESPLGTYSTMLPATAPLHGAATLSWTIDCGGSPTSHEFDLYIDPSGHVLDSHGTAIPGAQVTLFRSDSSSGPFIQVADGSAIMSPSNRANPDTTNADGHYGWDVVAGFYVVHATSADCYAPGSYNSTANTVQSVVVSAVQQIPPAVTDLDLTMDCTNIAPVAAFTQPSTAQVGHVVGFDATASKDANGSIASYSWDFGDGTPAVTGATPSHTYASIGTFAPTLTVIDDQQHRTVKTGPAVTVGSVPGTVGGLAASSGVHSVSLSWVAPAANNSAIDHYTVDVSPGGAHLTPTGTGVTVNGLSPNTSYTFTVTAHNGFGDSGAATTAAVAGAASKPTVAIATLPASLTKATTASVPFTTAVDPAVTLSSVTCAVDGGAPTACVSPKVVSGLGNGSHTVVITATDSDGNAGSTSAQWVVDTVLPTAAMIKPSSTTSLAKSFAVAWSGADANGVASYDVIYTRAAWNGKAGAATAWKSLTTATSAAFAGVPGNEYCFSVRTHDKAGNVSGFSAARCTAIPLDDRSLTASRGWKKLSGKAFYLGTAMQAAASGKTLTRKGAIAGRAVLYVDKGKGFGSLNVLYNGKVVKKISLASKRTLSKVAIALPKVTKKTTIVIKTTSAKKVQVDGLLLARI